VRIVVPRFSRLEPVVNAIELLTQHQRFLFFFLLLQIMRVVRACLRTMTTVIFIRLRVARRFIFHFFWYRLRFSEFFQVRILPEKLLVLLNRVHARVLFIQQFLQWARLLRTFETEEAQM